MEKKCRKCKETHKDWMGVEYAYGTPERYDGVSEWRCRRCNTRYGRWTDKILKEGKAEKPFGGK